MINKCVINKFAQIAKSYYIFINLYCKDTNLFLSFFFVDKNIAKELEKGIYNAQKTISRSECRIFLFLDKSSDNETQR